MANSEDFQLRCGQCGQYLGSATVRLEVQWTAAQQRYVADRLAKMLRCRNCLVQNT